MPDPTLQQRIAGGIDTLLSAIPAELANIRPAFERYRRYVADSRAGAAVQDFTTWIGTQTDETITSVCTQARNFYNGADGEPLRNIMSGLSQAGGGVSDGASNLMGRFSGFFQTTGGALGVLGGAAAGFMLGSALGGGGILGFLLGVIMAVVGAVTLGALGNSLSAPPLPTLPRDAAGPGQQPGIQILRAPVSQELSNGTGRPPETARQGQLIAYMGSDGQFINNPQPAANTSGIPTGARAAVLLHIENDQLIVDRFAALRPDSHWTSWRDRPAMMPEYIQLNRNGNQLEFGRHSTARFTASVPAAVQAIINTPATQNISTSSPAAATALQPHITVTQAPGSNNVTIRFDHGSLGQGIMEGQLNGNNISITRRRVVRNNISTDVPSFGSLYSNVFINNVPTTNGRVDTNALETRLRRNVVIDSSITTAFPAMTAALQTPAADLIKTAALTTDGPNGINPNNSLPNLGGGVGPISLT